MADHTTEEEFLYQLNLSKCSNVASNTRTIVAKKHMNTRSKSKLRKKASIQKSICRNTDTNLKKTVKTVRLNKRISCLKAANLKDQQLLNTSKITTTLKSASVHSQQVNNDSFLSHVTNEDNNNVTGFCRICRRAYSSKKEKVEHFKSPGHIVFVEAKKGTNYEALKEERDVFKDLKYPLKCSICGEGPYARREFLAHHRRHAGAQPFHCVRCKKKYFRKCDLLGHLRTHLDASQRFKCPRCPHAFTKRSSITAHLILKHNLPDTRPRKYKCTECGRGFLTKQDVDRHMRIHTGHIHARCSVCGKGCSSANALLQHQRVHTGETPFKCDQCPYVSKSKQLLVRHQRKHNGEKPFKCQLCTFECSQSSGLKRHMIKHAGSKPFKCPYCDHRSSNIENLRKHVKKTRKHKGLNVYPCKHCDFSTDFSSDYLKHLKQKHFPYLDEECSSATKLSGILIAKDEKQSVDGDDDKKRANLSSDSIQPITSSADDTPTIEMVIVSDSSQSITTVSHNTIPHTETDKVRPEVVSAAIDEIFLNALIKIPNLQQVILPPSDGNAPVTLVIGSDHNPYELAEESTLHQMHASASLIPVQQKCNLNQQPEQTMTTKTGVYFTRGHNRN